MWNPKVRSARHLPRFEPGPNILLWVREWDGAVPIPAIVQPKPLWSGKQVLSTVIPCGIHIHRSPDPKSFNLICDDGMMIENGGIIFGITEKKTVGASQGGLVHVVFCENGPDMTRLLFTGIQMVVNFRLFHNGFHIGIGDAIVNQSNGLHITEPKQNVTDIIEHA
jgi:DNA-directed RNA polymerase II subunit RPB1